MECLDDAKSVKGSQNASLLEQLEKLTVVILAVASCAAVTGCNVAICPVIIQSTVGEPKTPTKITNTPSSLIEAKLSRIRK